MRSRSWSLASFSVLLSVSACGPTPATTDAATTGDAGPPADTGMTHDVGTDTGMAPADANTGIDGGHVPLAELCAHFAGCTPGETVAACMTSVQAELDRVTALGCSAQAAAANDCSYSIFVPSGSGTCTPTLATCDAPYTAYNHCVVAATGVSAFSCQGSYYCITTTGSASTPAQGCPSGLGSVVTSCPTTGTIVGRCTTRVPGDVTVASTYYDPLPTGVTSATLQSLCTSGTTPGVWTTP